jgi:cell wall-associated NlpC family hydrolase
MNKSTIVAAISLSVLGLGINANESFAQEVGTITASSLNIRAGAGTKYSKVATVYKGTKVEIISSSNGWYKIKLSSGKIGWASSNYVTKSNTNQTAQAPSRGAGREVAVELAYKQLGKKYVWGAEGPNSFDCSGLTYYVYKNALGKTIPRTSAAQSNYGQYVPKGELQSGDLVFSGSSGKVSHVGIYIGNGKMIHAPQTGDVVKISEINSGYYKDRYITSRRP